MHAQCHVNSGLYVDDIDEVFAHSIIIASSSMISSFGKSQHTYEITDTGIFKLNKHWIVIKICPIFQKRYLEDLAKEQAQA